MWNKQPKINLAVKLFYPLLIVCTFFTFQVKGQATVNVAIASLSGGSSQVGYDDQLTLSITVPQSSSTINYSFDVSAPTALDNNGVAVPIAALSLFSNSAALTYTSTSSANTVTFSSSGATQSLTLILNIKYGCNFYNSTIPLAYTIGTNSSQVPVKILITQTLSTLTGSLTFNTGTGFTSNSNNSTQVGNIKTYSFDYGLDYAHIVNKSTQDNLALKVHPGAVYYRKVFLKNDGTIAFKGKIKFDDVLSGTSASSVTIQSVEFYTVSNAIFSNNLEYNTTESTSLYGTLINSITVSSPNNVTNANTIFGGSIVLNPNDILVIEEKIQVKPTSFSTLPVAADRGCITGNITSNITYNWLVDPAIASGSSTATYCSSDYPLSSNIIRDGYECDISIVKLKPSNNSTTHLFWDQSCVNGNANTVTWVYAISNSSLLPAYNVNVYLSNPYLPFATTSTPPRFSYSVIPASSIELNGTVLNTLGTYFPNSSSGFLYPVTPTITSNLLTSADFSTDYQTSTLNPGTGTPNLLKNYNLNFSWIKPNEVILIKFETQRICPQQETSSFVGKDDFLFNSGIDYNDWTLDITYENECPSSSIQAGAYNSMEMVDNPSIVPSANAHKVPNNPKQFTLPSSPAAINSPNLQSLDIYNPNPNNPLYYLTYNSYEINHTNTGTPDFLLNYPTTNTPSINFFSNNSFTNPIYKHFVINEMEKNISIEGERNEPDLLLGIQSGTTPMYMHPSAGYNGHPNIDKQEVELELKQLGGISNSNEPFAWQQYFLFMNQLIALNLGTTWTGDADNLLSPPTDYGKFKIYIRTDKGLFVDNGSSTNGYLTALNCNSSTVASNLQPDGLTWSLYPNTSNFKFVHEKNNTFNYQSIAYTNNYNEVFNSPNESIPTSLTNPALTNSTTQSETQFEVDVYDILKGIDSIYNASNASYALNVNRVTASQLKDAIENSKIKFLLSAVCPTSANLPGCRIRITYTPPGTNCNNGEIPIAEYKFNVNVMCPGCILPGIIARHSTLKRDLGDVSSFGYEDDNNDCIADNLNTVNLNGVQPNTINLMNSYAYKMELLNGQTPITNAYQLAHPVNLNHALVGDLLRFSVDAKFWDAGSGGCSYGSGNFYNYSTLSSINNSPYFKALYLEQQIQGSGTAKYETPHNGVNMKFFIPPATGDLSNRHIEFLIHDPNSSSVLNTIIANTSPGTFYYIDSINDGSKVWARFILNINRQCFKFDRYGNIGDYFEGFIYEVFPDSLCTGLSNVFTFEPNQEYKIVSYYTSDRNINNNSFELDPEITAVEMANNLFFTNEKMPSIGIPVSIGPQPDNVNAHYEDASQPSNGQAASPFTYSLNGYQNSLNSGSTAWTLSDFDPSNRKLFFYCEADGDNKLKIYHTNTDIRRVWRDAEHSSSCVKSCAVHIRARTGKYNNNFPNEYRIPKMLPDFLALYQAPSSYSLYNTVNSFIAASSTVGNTGNVYEYLATGLPAYSIESVGNPATNLNIPKFIFPAPIPLLSTYSMPNTAINNCKLYTMQNSINTTWFPNPPSSSDLYPNPNNLYNVNPDINNSWFAGDENYHFYTKFYFNAYNVSQGYNFAQVAANAYEIGNSNYYLNDAGVKFKLNTGNGIINEYDASTIAATEPPLYTLTPTASSAISANYDCAITHTTCIINPPNSNPQYSPAPYVIQKKNVVLQQFTFINDSRVNGSTNGAAINSAYLYIELIDAAGNSHMPAGMQIDPSATITLSIPGYGSVSGQLLSKGIFFPSFTISGPTGTLPKTLNNTLSFSVIGCPPSGTNQLIALPFELGLSCSAISTQQDFDLATKNILFYSANRPVGAVSSNITIHTGPDLYFLSPSVNLQLNDNGSDAVYYPCQDMTIHSSNPSVNEYVTFKAKLSLSSGSNNISGGINTLKLKLDFPQTLALYEIILIAPSTIVANGTGGTVTANPIHLRKNSCNPAIPLSPPAIGVTDNYGTSITSLFTNCFPHPGIQSHINVVSTSSGGIQSLSFDLDNNLLNYLSSSGQPPYYLLSGQYIDVELKFEPLCQYSGQAPSLSISGIPYCSSNSSNDPAVNSDVITQTVNFSPLTVPVTNPIVNFCTNLVNFTATQTITNSTCGAANGSFVLSSLVISSPPAPSYNVLVNGTLNQVYTSGSTITISNLAAGNYQLVLVPNGTSQCTSAPINFVIGGGMLTVPAYYVVDACSGNSNGQFVFTILGGVPLTTGSGSPTYSVAVYKNGNPYTYTNFIKVPVTVDQPNVNLWSIQGIVPSNTDIYEVHITDASGCSNLPIVFSNLHCNVIPSQFCSSSSTACAGSNDPPLTTYQLSSTSFTGGLKASSIVNSAFSNMFATKDRRYVFCNTFNVDQASGGYNGIFNLSNLPYLELCSGVQINVNPGATLIIDNSKLRSGDVSSSSNQLWNNIYIKDNGTIGGSLYIINATIRDATYGVYMDATTINAAPKVLLYNSKFINNSTGALFKYSGASITNANYNPVINPVSGYPITITNAQGVINSCSFLTSSAYPVKSGLNLSSTIGLDLQKWNEFYVGTNRQPTYQWGVGLGNNFTGLKYGIKLYKSALIARDNVIVGNGQLQSVGIMLNPESNTNVLIYHNVFKNSNYGVYSSTTSTTLMANHQFAIWQNQFDPPSSNSLSFMANGVRITGGLYDNTCRFDIYDNDFTTLGLYLGFILVTILLFKPAIR